MKIPDEIDILVEFTWIAPEESYIDIAGAEGLSMFDVEKISSHIANLNPKAKIIFGISKNPKLRSKIKTKKEKGGFFVPLKLRR